MASAPPLWLLASLRFPKLPLRHRAAPFPQGLVLSRGLSESKLHYYCAPPSLSLPLYCKSYIIIALGSWGLGGWFLGLGTLLGEASVRGGVCRLPGRSRCVRCKLLRAQWPCAHTSLVSYCHCCSGGPRKKQLVFNSKLRGLCMDLDLPNSPFSKPDYGHGFRPQWSLVRTFGSCLLPPQASCRCSRNPAAW